MTHACCTARIAEAADLELMTGLHRFYEPRHMQCLLLTCQCVVMKLEQQGCMLLTIMFLMARLAMKSKKSNETHYSEQHAKLLPKHHDIMVRNKQQPVCAFGTSSCMLIARKRQP